MKGAPGLWFRTSGGTESRGSGGFRRRSRSTNSDHLGRRLPLPGRDGLKTILPLQLICAHAPPFARPSLQTFVTFLTWLWPLRAKPPYSQRSERFTDFRRTGRTFLEGDPSASNPLSDVSPTTSEGSEGTTSTHESSLLHCLCVVPDEFLPLPIALPTSTPLPGN